MSLARTSLTVPLLALTCMLPAPGNAETITPRGLLVEREGNLVDAELTEAEAEKLLPVRANNYWSIKAPRHPYWLGQTSKDERDHAYFDDPAFSARAFFRLMHTYRYSYGLKSVLEIVSRFAPPTDTIGSIPGNAPNPTRRYAEYVAERVGVDARADLRLFLEDGTVDRERAVRFAQAFAAWELGGKFTVSDALIRQGIELAEL